MRTPWWLSEVIIAETLPLCSMLLLPQCRVYSLLLPITIPYEKNIIFAYVFLLLIAIYHRGVGLIPVPRVSQLGLGVIHPLSTLWFRKGC